MEKKKSPATARAPNLRGSDVGPLDTSGRQSQAHAAEEKSDRRAGEKERASHRSARPLGMAKYSRVYSCFWLISSPPCFSGKSI